MKITIVYGSARHGSTWNAEQLFKEEIGKKENCEATEFFLPKDLPEFCRGFDRQQKFHCRQDQKHT
jgi:hypothetical protein